MWYGNTSSGSFDGLVALVDSIFAMDSQRPMVIMTPVDMKSVNEPETDSGLLLLQRAYPRVLYVRVPRRTIFKNISEVKACKKGCGGSGTRSYMYTYSKFALWNLTQWSRLMYLDTDMLVTHPLHQIWATQIGTAGALVAGSRAIRAKAAIGVTEVSCRQTRRKIVPYNTGLLLLQPSKILADAILFEMENHWSNGIKSTCKSDQTYFNSIFPRHTKCLAYSTNCRDPQFLNESEPPHPKASLSVLSRCLDPLLDEPDHNRSVAAAAVPSTPPSTSYMPAPFTVHFACGTKPWLPTNNHLYFARKWQHHLAMAKEKIAYYSV